MYVYICIYVLVCNYVSVCIYLYVGAWMHVCVWLRGAAIRARLVRSRPVTGDSNLYSLWIQHTGDSKTDPWDDPKIRTGSCSEDQTAIQIQNYVISCECSFIDLFSFQRFILLFHANVYIISALSCSCRPLLLYRGTLML